MLEQHNLLNGAHIQITSFIPASCMVRRWTVVVRSETIGHPLRAVATTRTTWASTVVSSTQARTASPSTPVGWRVALAVYSCSVCSLSSGSHEHFKDFANAKYLEVGAKIPTGFPRPPLGPPQRGQGKQICRLCRQVQDFPQVRCGIIEVANKHHRERNDRLSYYHRLVE